MMLYCYLQVVFDPLVGLCGVYAHGEIKFAMVALIRVLDDNESWVHQERLSYVKVENVIHKWIVLSMDMIILVLLQFKMEFYVGYFH